MIIGEKRDFLQEKAGSLILFIDKFVFKQIFKHQMGSKVDQVFNNHTSFRELLITLSGITERKVGVI